MAGRRADLHALRRAMPKVFARVLEEQFRSNEEAALFFDVTERTIRNWKAMRNEPGGHHVMFLIQKRPGAARRLLGE
jgi:DNA-binding transcriptional regulator YiaG